jgi:hypothetical protein
MERRPVSDFYQTPHCLTQVFIDAYGKASWGSKKCGTISDYCSGYGAIVRVLQDNGYRVDYGDIDAPENLDFFTDIGPGEGCIGVMNPPFRLFNEWVRHCFEVYTHEFSLLGPTTYLQGIGRYNKEGTGIFQNKVYPLAYIYTFNRYPLLSTELRPDGFIETGMQSYSWFVWTRKSGNNKHFKKDTVHRWLDINSYILRKRAADNV